MLKKLLWALTLVFVATGAAFGGAILDEILNYTFMDQSTAMKGGPQLFDVQRNLTLTRDAPLGQTFVTGPETEKIMRVRAWLNPNSDWQPGEGAELVLWESPSKKVSLGRYTIWYEYRGFEFAQAEWEINARVKPNTEYYFEVSYVGNGDGKLCKMGAMNGRDGYPSGQGYQAGKEADFDLCFQTHSRKPMDRIASLKKAFARFDLSRPEFAEVKAAVDKEDFETAIAKTVAYFEAREKPIRVVDPKDVPSYNPEAETKGGDLAMQNYFMSAEMGSGYAGPDVNWRGATDFDERGNLAASNWDPNRYGPRGPLTAGYINTGNQKYAKKLNDLLVDWYLDNPPPGESKIGGNPWDKVWASLQDGIRLGHGFTAYSKIHTSPLFALDTRMAYILDMADHGDTLVIVGEGAGGNWSFTQNGSLMTFALNFPEFTNWKLWFDTAAQRIDGSLAKDWLPDGVETESAPGYQRFAYKPLVGIYELTKERGVTTGFAQKLRGLLEKQAEYFMYFAAPDGIAPFLGDWGHDQQRDSLADDAKRYNRPDMLYVATAGKEGTKPKELSKLYPYAGIVTMRSDWGDAGRPFDDARFLLLHGVHFGAHGHQDINGISGLYAYGRELLTDPGSHIYGSPEHQHLTEAVSHNLMTVDGQDQDRNGNTAFRNWATTPVADYLSSWAAVYKGGAYNREVFFVRSAGDPGAKDYWVVRDAARGKGTHSLEQRWHFVVGDVSVDKATLAASSAFPEKGNLAILQVDPARLEVEQTTADTWQPRGTAAAPLKLPTIIYRANAALPAAIDSVLAPFEGSKGPGLQLTTIERSPDGLDSAFKIVQGKLSDLFIFQKAAGKKSLASEKVSFDGERVFVRRIGGKLRSAMLVNGSSLTVDGKQVIKRDKPVPWVVVSFEKSGVKTYSADKDPGMALPATRS